MPKCFQVPHLCSQWRAVISIHANSVVSGRVHALVSFVSNSANSTTVASSVVDRLVVSQEKEHALELHCPDASYRLHEFSTFSSWARLFSVPFVWLLSIRDFCSIFCSSSMPDPCRCISDSDFWAGSSSNCSWYSAHRASKFCKSKLGILPQTFFKMPSRPRRDHRSLPFTINTEQNRAGRTKDDLGLTFRLPCQALQDYHPWRVSLVRFGQLPKMIVELTHGCRRRIEQQRFHLTAISAGSVKLSWKSICWHPHEYWMHHTRI